MSISPQQLEQIYQYLAEFWHIDYSVVTSEYEQGLFTLTEDQDDPNVVIVDHRTRTDLLIELDEL